MSKNSAPLISVIVAVFNGRDTLQQCIDSVAQQTYPNKELIIIDAGSNDSTVELIRANQDNITYWISEPDRGIYNAWNKGVLQANGEWICFLGADDYLWDSNVLGKVAGKLSSLSSEINIAYGQIMLLDKDGKELQLVGEPWEKAKETFAQKMSIPHQGVMHRRALFDRHGLFDETFRIAGDHEFLLRELKLSDAFYMSDIVMVGMRQGGISSNPKYTALFMREIIRIRQMHGLSVPSSFWVELFKIYVRMLG